MSIRTTTLAWEAAIPAESKLALLALADMSSDDGKECMIFGVNINRLQSLTGWEDERVENFIRVALGLRPRDDGGFPIGAYQGIGFDFERVIERLAEVDV